VHATLKNYHPGPNYERLYCCIGLVAGERSRSLVIFTAVYTTPDSIFSLCVCL